jgi:hypothetical protein
VIVVPRFEVYWREEMSKRVQNGGLSFLASGLLAAGIFPAAAGAADVSNGNSTLTINPTGSSPYVSQWVVDGVDQFGGTPVGGDQLNFFNGSSLVPLNSLTPTNSFFSDPICSVTYSTTLNGDNFTINVKDILGGGASGSGASNITETITVNNLGPASVPGVQPALVADGPVTFTIHDVVDYNVNGTANNDTLTLSPGPNPNTAEQTDPTGAKITFAATPVPTGFSLIHNGAGIPGLGPSTGDEAFSFTWDLSLAPGDSGIISITEAAMGINAPPTTIPLPSAAWSCITMLGGLGAFGVVKRFRQVIG